MINVYYRNKWERKGKTEMFDGNMIDFIAKHPHARDIIHVYNQVIGLDPGYMTDNYSFSTSASTSSGTIFSQINNGTWTVR